MAMIEVENLRKSYGDVEALAGVSFQVGKGEILGLLGPNGAGKTTCMKVITGFMASTSGTVRVDGVDVHENSLATRAKIGYLPENAPLYVEMSVCEYLRYVAEMRGIPRQERKSRMKETAETCGLTNVLHKPIGELSKGYRQRVGLAQALIHTPQVLVFDEPTSGLDPNQMAEIRRLIRKLGEDRTIILSTHNLPEVLQTCDRVVVVHSGKVVADGTAEELEKAAADNPPVVVKVALDGKDPGSVAELISELDGVREVEERGLVGGVTSFRISVSEGEDIRPVLSRKIFELGLPLHELKRDALDLEAVFRRLTHDD